jgi:hypothetical protein
MVLLLPACAAVTLLGVILGITLATHEISYYASGRGESKVCAVGGLVVVIALLQAVLRGTCHNSSCPAGTAG